MNTIHRGIWSGIMATGPMTISMFEIFKRLKSEKQSPLPPATLSSQLTKPFGLDQKVPAKFRPDMTLISHYAYGAACGVLYAFLQRRIPYHPIMKGGFFGLGVWAASYLGWIPALNLRASAYKMPVSRNGMMILAHLIWGASLGSTEEKLRKEAEQMLDGHRKRSEAE